MKGLELDFFEYYQPTFHKREFHPFQTYVANDIMNLICRKEDK